MKTHAPAIFSIAPGSSDPLYKQLMEQIRRMSAAGQLADGDLLPSVREVALALTLNPMTVSKAYNYLEVEGLLRRHRGVGMLVCISTKSHLHVTQDKHSQREELLRPSLERAALEAQQMGMSNSRALALFKQILGENK
ncbi:MAG: GntR family transcriptional regulator [Burkholderiales bacterium]|nr:GntR family transcriptional regulator [Burkholderiales bacterium]